VGDDVEDWAGGERERERETTGYEPLENRLRALGADRVEGVGDDVEELLRLGLEPHLLLSPDHLLAGFGLSNYFT